MSLENGVQSAELKDIWIWVHSREGTVEEVTFGLVSEARRLFFELGKKGKIVGVTFEPLLEEELQALGGYGVDRVLLIHDVSHISDQTNRSEMCSVILIELIKKQNPSFFLMAQTAETSDLAPRIAAALETGLITRAIDVGVDSQGETWAIRPTANGYLFEELYFVSRGPHLITLLPSVLSPEKISVPKSPEMIKTPWSGETENLKVKVIERTEASPEHLDLEDADIIICGGRGVGKDESMLMVNKLAKLLGGAAAGTRPLIDWKTLPFERQIGQTGKMVAPRLLVACGISGANEFTVGMEKSKLVMVINIDPRARMFRFADIGVVGDVHQILPLLVEEIQKMKELT